jgi:hypothetical protein
MAGAADRFQKAARGAARHVADDENSAIRNTCRPRAGRCEASRLPRQKPNASTCPGPAQVPERRGDLAPHEIDRRLMRLEDGAKGHPLVNRDLKVNHVFRRSFDFLRRSCWVRGVYLRRCSRSYAASQPFITGV